MNKNRKPPPPSRGGKGTAEFRQMGLLMDFSPENMMASGGDDDDDELEAEFLAIVGGEPDPKQKPNGKTPLPVEAIERMAALCMKDLDEEDGTEEDDLEDDDELMAELTEVLEEDGETRDIVVLAATETNDAPAASDGSESLLLDRLAMYKAAIANAKQAEESSKMRRYERGLKTLENLLVSVRKGKKIDEDEIPPPVVTGKNINCQQTVPLETIPASVASLAEVHAVLTSPFPSEPSVAACEQPPSKPAPASELPPKAPPPRLPKPKISPAPGLPLRSPETPQEISAPLASSVPSDSQASSTQTFLQARAREYKLAALRSKQEGNIEMATKYYRVAKSFEPILESLEKGEAVDLSKLPPPPDQLSKEMLSSGVQHTSASTATPLAQTVTPPAPEVSSAGERPAPCDMMEALQQRMDKYRTAAAQAKSKGDERKARMHERIVKQYQEVIKAHKAGKPVEFADLPVPPGFPPIQGIESFPRDQRFAGIMETAMKLVNEDEDAEETKKPDIYPISSKPVASVQPKLPHKPGLKVPSAAEKPAVTGKSAPKAIAKAQQQLAFLESRKKQLMQAALWAKQQNDIEGAKLFLRQAKGLDPMIEASQNGMPVDITKVPQAPVNKEEFVLVQRHGANVPPETAAQYAELVKLIKRQHEMCISYSKQFTHLGNITETIKFEKMAEDCKKNMEILKQAHGKGFPLPKYHYEQRTFSIIKIFPELNSNDMILWIVKGINFPGPPGITPGDLDAFVRFEFPYPNADEAQKDKTSVIKNSNCPEFQEKFKLFINRGHRGLKRAIQSKGIKFEIVHKGGLFKTDRVVGTAQLKLEALETTCELREILELLDGRRPTGGKLEVIVRLREPLTSQQLETTREKWLVIDPITIPPVALPKSNPAVAPVKNMGSSKPVCTLHSFNVLAFDKERLEKKMVAYKQPGQQLPNKLVEQHQNIVQMIQWQKSQLQHGGSAVMKEYLTQLEQYQQWYTEAARRLGSEGKREAAKEALYKRNLVESELQKFQK